MRKNTTMNFRAVLLACALGLGHAAAVQAQAVYPSAEAAAEALASALANADRDAVRRVLGGNLSRYVPEHSVGMEDVYAFLEAWSQSHSIAQVSPTRSELVVGKDWRFPAPIMKTARGWQFDVKAGQAEIAVRRIGRNELGAIETLKSLCAAQERYAQLVGQGKPARRIVSSPGQRDGLYWPEVTGALKSPLGPDALVMGADTPTDAALHGYHYRLLPGADAKGCAFAAWPARYGSYGVSSFVIGPDGVVRERDLGASSSASAARIQAGGAGEGWTAVQ
jgi:hypothetical protein